MENERKLGEVTIEKIRNLKKGEKLKLIQLMIDGKNVEERVLYYTHEKDLSGIICIEGNYFYTTWKHYVCKCIGNSVEDMIKDVKAEYDDGMIDNETFVDRMASLRYVKLCDEDKAVFCIDKTIEFGFNCFIVLAKESKI